MAAVPQTISAWESARLKRCYKQFIDLKCVKNSRHEELVADALDFDITQLDESKMKAHILDCAAALRLVQQERIRQDKPLILQDGEQPLTEQTQTALNNLFSTAVGCVLDQPSHNEGMTQLMRAFPDNSKLTDGRTWLPLHWAAVTNGVTEIDMKLVYNSNPTALQQYHQHGTDVNHMGFTPAHLLCMKAVTKSSMSLIQHFAEISQGQAFTMSASYPERGDSLLYGFSALHVACWGGAAHNGASPVLAATRQFANEEDMQRRWCLHSSGLSLQKQQSL